MYGKGLRPLSIASVCFLAVAGAMVAFYAPLDATEGIRQKIFYVHVPLSTIALGGFVAGGIMAVRHLRTGDPGWDMRSYVAIHLSIVFGVGALLTGGIWAKAAWGHWWLWSEPTLVSFLIVFLLYCCYQPLRFSIADPERQARYAAVFAIAAGAFVPINFIAVRLATAQVHPRVLSNVHNLPPRMLLTFIVAMVGGTLLFVTLWKFELTSKSAKLELKRLRARVEGEAAEQPAPRAPVGTPVASH